MGEAPLISPRTCGRATSTNELQPEPAPASSSLFEAAPSRNGWPGADSTPPDADTKSRAVEDADMKSRASTAWRFRSAALAPCRGVRGSAAVFDIYIYIYIYKNKNKYTYIYVCVCVCVCVCLSVCREGGAALKPNPSNQIQEPLRGSSPV